MKNEVQKINDFWKSSIREARGDLAPRRHSIQKTFLKIIYLKIIYLKIDDIWTEIPTRI
jgi:hypothetical protein